LIVSGGYVNQAGVQAAIGSWGSTLMLAASGGVNYQAIVIPAAVTAANAPPAIGQCQVDDVEGSLFLTEPSVLGVYLIGFGIYISKFDKASGTWSTKDPTNATEAAGDDWIVLRAVRVSLPTQGVVTDSMLLEFRCNLPHPITLGGGEALHVCIYSVAANPGSLNLTPYFRTRIQDVV